MDLGRVLAKTSANTGGAGSQTNEDAVTYCNCMSQIRQRLALVQDVLQRKVTTGFEVFDTELVFLQLRKTLELIAFSSLAANKEKYSSVHRAFSTHWKAKNMLEAIGKLNPNFYPLPLLPPRRLPNGVKEFTPLADGFLTKADFEILYDKCSEVLHQRNPFSTSDPVIQLGYSVSEWIARIQLLLALHTIELVTKAGGWFKYPIKVRSYFTPAIRFLN